LRIENNKELGTSSKKF